MWRWKRRVVIEWPDREPTVTQVPRKYAERIAYLDAIYDGQRGATAVRLEAGPPWRTIRSIRVVG